MQIKEVISIIESIANPAWQAEWDKSGLQVASSITEITHIGVCLDPLPESIHKGLQKKVDFFLAHHPLSLKPHLPNKIDSYYEALSLLFQANAPLYAAHTSLDVNMKGPSGWLGRELGLKNMLPLEPICSGAPDLGYGFTGLLPKPETIPSLVERLLNILKLDCALITGPEQTCMIEKIAVCGGSGSSLLEIAQASRAGLYITGDIKYHTALCAQIPVLDVGHHSIEEEMMRRFALLLGEKLPSVTVEFIASRSPFRMACK